MARSSTILCPSPDSVSAFLPAASSHRPIHGLSLIRAPPAPARSTGVELPRQKMSSAETHPERAAGGQSYPELGAVRRNTHHNSRSLVRIFPNFRPQDPRKEMFLQGNTQAGPAFSAEQRPGETVQLGPEPRSRGPSVPFFTMQRPVPASISGPQSRKATSCSL